MITGLRAAREVLAALSGEPPPDEPEPVPEGEGYDDGEGGWTPGGGRRSRPSGAGRPSGRSGATPEAERSNIIAELRTLVRRLEEGDLGAVPGIGGGASTPGGGGVRGPDDLRAALLSELASGARYPETRTVLLQELLRAPFPVLAKWAGGSADDAAGGGAGPGSATGLSRLDAWLRDAVTAKSVSLIRLALRVIHRATEAVSAGAGRGAAPPPQALLLPLLKASGVLKTVRGWLLLHPSEQVKVLARALWTAWGKLFGTGDGPAAKAARRDGIGGDGEGGGAEEEERAAALAARQAKEAAKLACDKEASMGASSYSSLLAKLDSPPKGSDPALSRASHPFTRPLAPPFPQAAFKQAEAALQDKQEAALAAAAAATVAAQEALRSSKAATARLQVSHGRLFGGIFAAGCVYALFSSKHAEDSLPFPVHILRLAGARGRGRAS